MHAILILGLAVALLASSAAPQRIEFRAKDLKECEQSKDNPGQAIESCSRLISQFGRSAVATQPGKADEVLVSAYFHRAAAYLQRGDFNFAIQDYDQAIRLNPQYAAAYHNRGIIHARNGEYERAVQDYDEAIRLDPNDAGAFINRGVVYQDKRQYEPAIADYSQAIRIDPKNPYGFMNRGNTYEEIGQYDLALLDHDQAVRLKPNEAKTFMNRGNVYRDKRQYDRAVQDYDQAVRLKPNYVNAFINRGIARFMQGQFAAAVPDFTRARELSPDYMLPAVWLFVASSRVGRDAVDPGMKEMKNADLKKWPGPIVSFYAGTLAAEALLEAAANSDAETQRYQLCQAYFFLGEYQLLRGLKKEAADEFKLVQTTCQPPFAVFHSVAKVELERLAP